MGFLLDKILFVPCGVASVTLHTFHEWRYKFQALFLHREDEGDRERAKLAEVLLSTVTDDDGSGVREQEALA